MTEFIDLLYCSDGFGEGEILAWAPMNAYIRKGDLIRIEGVDYHYTVSCQATIQKDSDIYNLITEAFGEPKKVTDKYSHQEIGGNENE